MSESDIRKSLVQFFRDQFSIELDSTSTDLVEAGILDSLMLIELVAHIEEQFAVTTELDDLEMENFVSVDNMAQFVAARLPSSGREDRDEEPSAAIGSGERVAGGEGG